MADIYIKVGKDNVVTMIHRMPFDPKHGLGQTRAELEESGYFVKDIPEPTHVKGRIAVPKYDKLRKQVYYTYEFKPLSTSDRLDSIESLLNEALMSGKL